MEAVEFRDFVLTFLIDARPDLAEQIGALENCSDIFEAGVADSHTFINLCLAIEERTGAQIDFAELDPEEFSSIDGLRAISAGN